MARGRWSIHINGRMFMNTFPDHDSALRFGEEFLARGAAKAGALAKWPASYVLFQDGIKRERGEYVQEIRAMRHFEDA